MNDSKIYVCFYLFVCLFTKSSSSSLQAFLRATPSLSSWSWWLSHCDDMMIMMTMMLVVMVIMIMLVVNDSEWKNVLVEWVTLYRFSIWGPDLFNVLQRLQKNRGSFIFCVEIFLLLLLTWSLQFVWRVFIFALRFFTTVNNYWLD